MSAHGYISNRFYSVEEYLEMEAKSELRYEYLDGADFVPANNPFNHNEIAANINQCLRTHFDRKEYRIFQETVRLSAEDDDGKLLMPDVVLVKTASVQDEDETIINPLLIAEVSTTATSYDDWYTKGTKYRAITSLQYLLFVSQREVLVELYSRNGPDTYLCEIFERPEDIISLPQLSFSISCHQIYDGIIFPKPIGLPMGLYSED